MSRAPTRRCAAAARLLTTAAILLLRTDALLAQRATDASTAWLFTWTLTPQTAGRPVNGESQVLDVAIWHGVARIGVRAGALRSFTGERGTMLLRSMDSTLAMINPVARETLTGTLSELAAMMGGGASPLVALKDVHSVTRMRGAGEPIVRFGTRRVELTQRFTLRINAAAMKRDLRNEQVVIIDISRDVARLDPAFLVFAEQFARTVGVPLSMRRELRAAERGVPAGFPVRTMTAALTIVGNDTVRTTTRAEMSLLRRELVDTTTFVAPSEFRVTQLSRLLQRGRRP